MSDRLDATIYGAIANTLENMAFLAVESELEGPTRYPAEETMCCRLLIHDPVQGEMYLLMPEPLLRKIASTVYILPEEELTEQMVLDMLGELINTAAGLFMNNYLPKNQTYALGLPETGIEMPKTALSTMKEWEFQADGVLFSLALAGDGFFPD
jgi:hypothetical protein